MGLNMISTSSLLLFVAAAGVIAITPGPGILYVAARTLTGGRAEGLASSFGTGLGGLVHVVAGAVGVSALVMTSAEAFTILKLIGAAYLIWLGIKTFREARTPLATDVVETTGPSRAFRDGVMVEAFNPKTAAFFLAFLPQFVDPAQGSVALQFAVLGMMSVILNTLVDVIVAYMASSVRGGLTRRPKLLWRVREGAGVLICGLGASLALARRAT